MGLGSAVDRDLSRKHLYGHKPNRCGRGFHCACAPVGAVANSDTLDVVATLVYPAGSYRVLKSVNFGWSRLRADHSLLCVLGWRFISAAGFL
jgi:hypothetical protein